MGGNKKRKREEKRPTIHPKNKYSENPPDFAHLASLYPSFDPFVQYSHHGQPRIDWTDFNATRELTRVLLHHDHALNWYFAFYAPCCVSCFHVLSFSFGLSGTRVVVTCVVFYDFIVLLISSFYTSSYHIGTCIDILLMNQFCRWIPDGQLCPTVPNRSNYIHWVEDLLSSDIIPNTVSAGGKVRGFDIGTGANCIYPLLGASLLGWSFVGSGMLLFLAL